MNELQRYYLGSLAERLVELDTLRPDATGGGTAATTAESLGRLHTIAHRLKGTGASYGFDAISERAAELEEALGPENVSTAVVEALEALMATIRETVAAGPDE